MGEGDVEAASVGARALAVLIDALVQLALFLLAIVVGGEAREANEAAGIAVALVGYAGAFLYAPLLLRRRGARNGQTLGKQVVGIRVVMARDVDFVDAVVREVLAKNLMGAVTLGVNFLWPLFDARSQALHDKFVNSLVVRAA